MAIDHVSLTVFSLTACQERVVGRDTPLDGLALSETTLARVEALRAIATLTEFEALPANWDGYGALSIDPDAIRNSKAAIASLVRRAPGPDIAPNPNGTISFEWMSERGSAHLEIGKTRFSFYVKPIGGNASLSEGRATEVPLDLGTLVAAIVFPPVRSITAITKLKYTAEHERASG